MISAGNDIVCLNAIDIARTKQHRFYSKILSPGEKQLYNQPGFVAVPFESFVWLLWSAKESAYKFLQRVKPDLVFTPIKFVVAHIEAPRAYTVTNFEANEMEGLGFDDTPAFQAIITYGTDALYSRSLMYPELILSTVNGDDDFKDTFWGIKYIEQSEPDYQSATVRTFLLDRLQRAFQLDDLTISKNPIGVPIALKDGKELDIAVSLSHHDRWVAYSFQPGDSL